MPKLKKHGFTLIEVLVCLVLLSIIGAAFMRLASGYYRTHYEAEWTNKVFVENMNAIEYAKANVKKYNDLLSFKNELLDDNPNNVVDIKQLNDMPIYKVTVNKEYREKTMPNTAVSAVIRVED